METAPLTVLDPANPALVAAYEHAFHRAFRKAVENRLVRTLWQWDDAAQRLSTHIGYDQQIIYIQPGTDCAVGAALAVNTGMQHLQASAFGFSVPDDAVAPCEILTFFTAEDHHLANRVALLRDGFNDLRHRGYRDILATTAQRPLATYRRFFSAFNGRITQTAVIDGEARYFLRYAPPSFGNQIGHSAAAVASAGATPVSAA